MRYIEDVAIALAWCRR